MLDGTLAGIQILAPQEYLRRVVEWDVPVMEEPPKLRWEKGTGSYVTKCGKYRLIKDGLNNRWVPQIPGKFLEWLDIADPGTVTEAKRACQLHYEAANPSKPKLDADGNPKLSPMSKSNARYQAFIERNPGRIPVTRGDLDKALRVQRAVRDNPDARALLDSRWETEYTIVWVHPSGALCKARLDMLTDPRRRPCTIVDLKLARDIEERVFNRTAASREYHAQLAWYGDGLRAHFPGAEIRYALLAVCSQGSHDSSVFRFGSGYELAGDEPKEIQAGRELNEERIKDLCYYETEYGDDPWPCRLPTATIDFAEHAQWALGDDGGGGFMGGPKVDFGDIPNE
jgi:hypothetical protein